MSHMPSVLPDCLRHSHVRARFGAGTLDRLGDESVGAGATRVLIVTDRGIVAAGHVARAEAAIRAAGAVLQYVLETQKATLHHLDPPLRHDPAACVQIDEATRRSLEIARTLRDGRREGSLLAIVDAATIVATGIIPRNRNSRFAPQSACEKSHVHVPAIASTHA